MRKKLILTLVALILPMAHVLPESPKASKPFFQSQLIFEPGSVAGFPSCHASTLVELPDGELLAAWYAGREEGAPDVAELCARLDKGARSWSKPQVLVDTPGKSDGNPVLHVDRRGRVWMFYVTMEGKRRLHWAGCPLKCRVSEDGGHSFGPERILHAEYGWMDRNKPIYLANGNLLLPLYDERNWTSFMLISSDDGATWERSQTLSGKGGNIQPTVVQLSDGSLLALMRTGSRHHRLWKATSRDNGRIWTPPVETDLPNPDSACDMVRLADGHLVLAFNDTAHGRTPLTVALSTNEGRSWTYKRNLETARGEYSYPSIIQTRDSLIHVTYTYRRKSIKHAVFNEAWIEK